MIRHRHAARPHRSSLLFTAGAVACAFLLTAPAPAALQVTLEKIVEAGPTTEFGRQLGAPWFSGGSVYHSRTIAGQAASLWGIYQGNSQIASWGGQITGSEVNNLFMADVSPSAQLISAFSNHGLPATTYKGSLNIATGGSPSRILSGSSVLPGYPTPHPGNPITSRASIDGTSVAFFINPYQFSTPPAKGAMALTSTSGSPITIIAREGDAVPNSGGTFNAFDLTARPWLDGGRVIFPGNGTLKRGIYEWNGSTLSAVVDSSMARPGGGTFSSTLPASFAVSSGTDYAFVTGTSSNALYRKSGSTFTLIASTATPIPGGTGNFFTFANPSLRNGRLIFIGFRDNQFSPPKEYGIYTDLAGTIDPIVDMRTSFGSPGKTVDIFEIANGRAWAGADTVYFTVHFTDRSSAIYRATFTPAAGTLASTTLFTGPRSGTITVPSRTGFNYMLRRSENLTTWSAPVSTTPGTGNPIAIPFSETNTALKRMFFRVEETAQ